MTMEFFDTVRYQKAVAKILLDHFPGEIYADVRSQIFEASFGGQQNAIECVIGIPAARFMNDSDLRRLATVAFYCEVERDIAARFSHGRPSAAMQALFELCDREDTQ